jgi:hypothetical protein
MTLPIRPDERQRANSEKWAQVLGATCRYWMNKPPLGRLSSF